MPHSPDPDRFLGRFLPAEKASHIYALCARGSPAPAVLSWGLVMMVRWTRALALAAGVLLGLSCAVPATAQVIVENRGGSGPTVATYAQGQSVTLPSGVAGLNNFSFNFYDSANNNGFASGRLFLLNTSYLGTPATLSSLTPGYIADTTAAGNLWTFSLPGQGLSSGQIFFYMDAPSGVSLKVASSSNYGGGNQYVANSASMNYGNQSARDLDFTIANAAAPSPGPVPGAGLISWLIAALTAAGVYGWTRLQKRREAEPTLA